MLTSERQEIGKWVIIMQESQERMWCIGCWYELDPAVQECPKCGRVFSNSDRASYYSGPMSYWSCLDLHIISMCVLMCPLGVVCPWPLVAAACLFLVPQGIIFTHVIQQARSDATKANTAYLVVNELLVIAIALTTALVGALVWW